MSYKEKEQQGWEQAFSILPQRLWKDFEVFIETGETSEEFMDILENDRKLKDSVELILRNDDLGIVITNTLKEGNP